MMPTNRQFAGNNTARVETDSMTLWFSYATLVAFKVEGSARVVRENDWSTTTGRHINAIDGGTREAKANRVNRATFERLWAEQTEASRPLTLKGSES